MNKPRKAAYRHLQSGSRYHAGEISGLMIGQKRMGTLTDLREDYRLFKRKAEMRTDARIEHFATWVKDYKPDDGGWRRHAHIVWTCKETDFHTLLKWLEDSAKKQMSLWVDRNIEKSPWKLGYALQYNADQKGESIRFSMSRDWLPQGYQRKWLEICKEGNDRTLNDKVLDLNSWIDLQRLKNHDWTKQTELKFDTMPLPHRTAYGNIPFENGVTLRAGGFDAGTDPDGRKIEGINRQPFVKRRLKNV